MILEIRQDSDPMIMAHLQAKRTRSKDGNSLQGQNSQIYRSKYSNIESKLASSRDHVQHEDTDYGNPFNPMCEKPKELPGEIRLKT